MQISLSTIEMLSLNDNVDSSENACLPREKMTRWRRLLQIKKKRGSNSLLNRHLSVGIYTHMYMYIPTRLSVLV